MTDAGRKGSPDLDASQARYRVAGLVYLVVATAVIALTLANPALASPERRADVAHLLVGLPFIVLFAALIAWGDRAFAAVARAFGTAADRAGAIGRSIREKLVMLLTLSALGRALVFAANGFGFRPRLNVGVPLESIPPNPEMLINAALMAIVVAVLVRASWLPFLERWRLRTSTGG